MTAPEWNLGVPELIILGVVAAGLLALGFYLMTGRKDE